MLVRELIDAMDNDRTIKTMAQVIRMDGKYWIWTQEMGRDFIEASKEEVKRILDLNEKT